MRVAPRDHWLNSKLARAAVLRHVEMPDYFEDHLGRRMSWKGLHARAVAKYPVLELPRSLPRFIVDQRRDDPYYEPLPEA